MVLLTIDSFEVLVAGLEGLGDVVAPGLDKDVYGGERGEVNLHVSSVSELSANETQLKYFFPRRSRHPTRIYLFHYSKL
jgi:hypothetical protein